jgi:hypothetical protein
MRLGRSSPNKVLKPLRVTSPLHPLSLSPLRQGIPTTSTGEVPTKMGSVVHFRKSGQGEDAQEASWSHHTENFSGDQTGQEDPALGPEGFSQLVGQDPHGDFVTSCQKR